MTGARTAGSMVAVAALLALVPAAQSRIYEVNSHADHAPGRCTRADCTLREAIVAANARRGADTVILRSTRPFDLTRRSTAEDAAADGDLDVTSGPLTIVHPGRGRAVIDANRVDRVFDIGRARTRLERLTIRGGQANPLDSGGDGGGISAGDIGDAPLTIVDSHVVGNRASAVDGNGGGIDTDIRGPLRIVRSRIAGNDAAGDGGGITGSIDGAVFVKASTITGNQAGEGGGVMVVGRASISSSTIAGNTAVSGADGELGDGAGVYVDDEGVLALVNSTVAGNRAIASGAGLFGEAGARAKLNAVTIARNRADSDDAGGGTGGGVFADAATVAVANSILAVNSATAGVRSDCGGARFTGAARNLISTQIGGCRPGAAIVASDPRLGPLARNGGPTATISLRFGSRAIGAAGASAPRRDQRGVRRADPDMGAYERR